jgi:hypothetical protein
MRATTSAAFRSHQRQTLAAERAHMRELIARDAAQPPAPRSAPHDAATRAFAVGDVVINLEHTPCRVLAPLDAARGLLVRIIGTDQKFYADPAKCRLAPQ